MDTQAKLPIIPMQPPAQVWRMAQEECQNRLDASRAQAITLEPQDAANGTVVTVRCSQSKAGSLTVTLRFAKPHARTFRRAVPAE